MDHPSLPVDRPARRPVRAVVILALCAAAPAACRPAAPATPAAPAITTPALATADVAAAPSDAPPALPTVDAADAPDDAGYIVSPAGHSALRHAAGYVPLDIGPAGPFLVDMQSHLGAGDLAWPVTAIGSDAPMLSVGALDDAAAALDVAAPDVAAALGELVGGGSRPVIQGYFASAGDDPVVLDWEGASDGIAVDALDIVLTGWRGEAAIFADGSSSSSPGTAPATAVWHFTHDPHASTGTDAAAWRWRSWRWSRDGAYPATVAAIERGLDGPGHDRYTYYHVVRPRALWPSPVAEATRDVPSPDGRWIARQIDGGGAQVEPRDERSRLEYSAVEIVDAAGKVAARPMAVWQYEDMGYARPTVFGWRPGHEQVVVGEAGSGDGCDLHGGARLHLCDVPSGKLTPLAVGGWHASFDPSGARLASLWLMRDGQDANGQYRLKGVVRMLAVDAGSVVTATFAAQEFDDRITWSPDGTALVATAVDDYAVCAQYNASHLVRFDVATGRVADLTAAAPGLRRVTAWRSDGTLDVDVFDAGYVQWDAKATRSERRDAATGALIAP